MIKGLPLTIFQASVVFLGGVVLIGVKFLIDVARSPRPIPIKVRKRDGNETIRRP